MKLYILWLRTANKKQQEDLHNNTVSLNASTVATLFNEEGYDLDKIRRGESISRTPGNENGSKGCCN